MIGDPSSANNKDPAVMALSLGISGDAMTISKAGVATTPSSTISAMGVTAGESYLAVGTGLPRYEGTAVTRPFPASDSAAWSSSPYAGRSNSTILVSRRSSLNWQAMLTGMGSGSIRLATGSVINRSTGTTRVSGIASTIADSSCTFSKSGMTIAPTFPRSQVPVDVSVSNRSRTPPHTLTASGGIDVTSKRARPTPEQSTQRSHASRPIYSATSKVSSGVSGTSGADSPLTFTGNGMKIAGEAPERIIVPF